jgi:hypothetical protein
VKPTAIDLFGKFEATDKGVVYEGAFGKRELGKDPPAGTVSTTLSVSLIW